MNTFKCITKICVALAAVAGAVYVVATYGDQIVALCKRAYELTKRRCCKCCCHQQDVPADAENGESIPVANDNDFE